MFLVDVHHYNTIKNLRYPRNLRENQPPADLGDHADNMG